MNLSELAKSCQEIIDTVESSHDEGLLQAAFEKIAKYIVLRGHFDVPGGLPIYPVDIEFYFHQEGESAALIKDPIMYHTYDHEKENLKRSGRSELPYYVLGTLNPHQSGIDVTFENPSRHYRASFLIRGYRIGSLKSKKIPFSTFVYDDLLIMGIPENGTGITWVEDDRIAELETPSQRQNVYLYKIDEGGKLQKLEEKDPRKWRFKLK